MLSVRRLAPMALLILAALSPVTALGAGPVSAPLADGADTVAAPEAYPPLPACEYLDITTRFRRYADWRKTLVDTNLRVGARYKPPDLVSVSRGRHRGQRAGPRDRHRRSARDGQGRPEGRRRHRGPLRLSQLPPADLGVQRLGRPLGLPAGPALQRPTRVTRSTSWASPSTSGARPRPHRPGTTPTGRPRGPALGCSGTRGSSAGC